MLTPSEETWEERFNAEFTVGGSYWKPEKEWQSFGNQLQADAIKAFISRILKEREATVRQEAYQAGKEAGMEEEGVGCSDHCEAAKKEGYAEGRKAALGEMRPHVLELANNLERYFTINADRRGETGLSTGMRAAIKKLGDELAALSTGNEEDNGDRLAKQGRDAIDKGMLECFRGNEEGEKEV